MFPKILPIALLALGAGIQPALSHEQPVTVQAIDAASRGSVVFIRSTRAPKDGIGAPESESGTGFIVSEGGYVLTTAHLLMEPDPGSIVSYEASIRSRHGQAYPLTLVAEDSKTDVALFLLPDVGVRWKPLSIDLPLMNYSLGSEGETDDRICQYEKKLESSAELFTMGFPLEQDLSSAQGILSNKYGIRGFWQTTLPINYGNSGSPVFRLEDGCVVGIAQGGIDRAQGITYVIPIAYAGAMVYMARSVALEPRKQDQENFAFYASVSEGHQQDVTKTFCGPSGTIASVQGISLVTKSGEATGITSITSQPEHPNCLSVSAHISGTSSSSVVRMPASAPASAPDSMPAPASAPPSGDDARAKTGGWLGAGVGIKFVKTRAH